MVHKHNGILLSHKMNKITAIAATWMYLEIITISEASHKEKYHKISLICGL